MNCLHMLIGRVGASRKYARNSGRGNAQPRSKVLLAQTIMVHNLTYSVLHCSSRIKSPQRLVSLSVEDYI